MSTSTSQLRSSPANHSLQESFKRNLKELADQMWQSTLQSTLQDEQLQKQLSSKDVSVEEIASYEDLFQALADKDLITPNDLSLLRNILKNVDARSEALLWAMYEAGFGQTGLDHDRSSNTCQRATSRNHSFQFKRSNCQSKFKRMLRNIGKQIRSGEDLSALKLLCKDAVCRTQLESASNGLELLTALQKRHCITAMSPEFLYCILRDCGRRDLCSFIDSYVYLCVKKKQDEDQAAAHDTIFYPEEETKKSAHSRHRFLGKCQTNCGGQNYLFCRSLKLLGDDLGMQDLQSMKLIAGSCIPDSRLEKVKNIYDLFILLDERGRLSPQDLSFLELLLEDKMHLVHQLYELGFGQKSKPIRNDSNPESLNSLPMYMLFSQDPAQLLLNFKRLLKTVGIHLTSDNIKDIKYLCPDEIGCLEDIDSGLELLTTLEKWLEITPTNVGFLMEVLEGIGRKDLCTFVKLYQNSAPKSLQRMSSRSVGVNGSEVITTGSDQSSSPNKESQETIATVPAEELLQCNNEDLQEHLRTMEEALTKEREEHEKEKAELIESLKQSKEECNALHRKIASLYETLQERDEAKISALQLQHEIQALELKHMKSEHQSFAVRTQMELDDRDQKIHELSNRISKQETVIQGLMVHW